MKPTQRQLNPPSIITLALSLSVIIPLTNYIMMSSSPTPAPITLILDFDGTITTKDTISPLFAAALDFHIQRGRSEEEMRLALKEILSGYMSDLDAYEKLHPRPQGGVEEEDDEEEKGNLGQRRTVREVVAYQRGLRGVEARSFERVSRSGILGGLNEETWALVARRAVEEGGKEGIVVRKGFQSLVGKLGEVRGAWRVLSVNFSESWIRGILSTQGVGGVEILANQPDELGRVHGPKGENGRRGDVVVTSDGKLATMLESLKEVAVGSSKVVYIGDSPTDIECLLQEGITGIVMVGEDGTSKLLEMLRLVSSDEGYGYLKDMRDIKEFSDAQGKALYFAKDFEDIRDSPLFD